MEARMARPRSIVGPAVLIVLGALFLANNLGLLDRSVWQLVLQLWPLVLVALGLDILLRRSTLGGVGAAISIAAVVLVLATAAAVVTTGPHITLGERGMVINTTGASGPVVRLGGPVHSQAIVQSLDGAERAVVELNLGVGQVTVGTMQETSGLVEGSLALGEDERVAQEYHVSGGTGYFKLSGASPSVVRGGSSLDGNERNWDLRLNPGVPTDLKLNTGVGSARMDLTGMRLTSLRIDSGVGNSDVKLPGKGQYHVTVNGGVGRTTIQVPRGMPARIEVDRGLASVDIDGEFRRNGSIYTSRDYQPGPNTLEMMIHGGIGKIAVTESQ